MGSLEESPSGRPAGEPGWPLRCFWSLFSPGCPCWPGGPGRSGDGRDTCGGVCGGDGTPGSGIEGPGDGREGGAGVEGGLGLGIVGMLLVGGRGDGGMGFGGIGFLHPASTSNSARDPNPTLDFVLSIFAPLTAPR
ncbi:MAG: hypothetical protein CMQ24_16330 [Gammaproteobacteria bacterium]|nr:hypothetical protein [Gammaproteobacteria bacterium]